MKWSEVDVSLNHDVMAVFPLLKCVGKPLFTKHPASPVHLHVPISTIEFLLKLTPACSRNT